MFWKSSNLSKMKVLICIWGLTDGHLVRFQLIYHASRTCYSCVSTNFLLPWWFFWPENRHFLLKRRGVIPKKYAPPVKLEQEKSNFQNMPSQYWPWHCNIKFFWDKLWYSPSLLFLKSLNLQKNTKRSLQHTFSVIWDKKIQPRVVTLPFSYQILIPGVHAIYRKVMWGLLGVTCIMTWGPHLIHFKGRRKIFL